MPPEPMQRHTFKIVAIGNETLPEQRFKTFGRFGCLKVGLGISRGLLLYEIINDLFFV